MTKYKRTDFEEDDIASSNGSLTADIPSLGRTHIRYRNGYDLWNSRTKLEKIFTIIIGVLALLVIILTAVIGSHHNKPPQYKFVHFTQRTNQTESNLCLTKECVTVASALLNSIDASVNPCEDFYEYACGGWIKKNPIPEGRAFWGIFDQLWQENQLVMKNVLEGKLSSKASKAEYKAQVYYNSCMDLNNTIDKLGAKPLLDVIAKVGGWNISGSFSLTNWNFQTILERLFSSFYMGGFFTWLVAEDDKESSKYILQIDQGGLTLPTRDYYLNKTKDDKVLSAYLDYMTTIGVLLGGTVNETRRQMKEIINLEIQLAEITIPADERRDDEKLYHKMRIRDLMQLSPAIDWVQYFNNSFRVIKRKITANDSIVVYAPDYLKNLSEVLTTYLSTTDGKIIINNYLVWQTVKSLTSYLSKPFRDASKILRKALVGSEGREEKWRYCVSETNNVIGFALGAMFVREVFKGESKIVAEKMIEEIKTAFKENLPLLKWMDDETRQLAKEKADAVTDMIGFPDYILYPDQLDEKYAGLEFNQTEFFENNLRVNVYSMRKTLARIDQPVNRTRWGMTPPTVNAYYTPTKNQIVFPAGILQAPFYDPKFPKSLNFGGMGVVMGHELIHAFDDEGREYDKYGNMHPWWKNSTIEKFKKQTECIINQYSNYSVNGEYLNGKQTLGENIADNGGLKAAYHAYDAWHLIHPDEMPLPGVNLTHQQLFFVGFAQVWCSVKTKEAIHLQILNDPHSLPKYRVNGAVSNSVDFSREFKCLQNTAMNRIEKCEIW